MTHDKFQIKNNVDYESIVNAEFIQKWMSTSKYPQLLSHDKELTLVFLDQLRLLRGVKLGDMKRNVNVKSLEVSSSYSKCSNSTKRSKAHGARSLPSYPNKFSPHRSACQSSTSQESHSSKLHENEESSASLGYGH